MGFPVYVACIFSIIILYEFVHLQIFLCFKLVSEFKTLCGVAQLGWLGTL
jgi:hypothetical protein